MEAEEKNNNSREEQRNILLNNERCDQCGMLFTSSDSLRIHKEKFCIGVMDSGVNRTDSPPINSKYIEKMKEQNQFSNEEIEDSKKEMEIMDENNKNENLNDSFIEYEELGHNTSREIINDKNIDDNQELFSDEKDKAQISPNNEYFNEELIQSKQKVNETPVNYSDSRQNEIDENYNSKTIGDTSYQKEEETSKNDQIKDNLTRRSDQVSVYSNTRYIGTPNDKISFIDPTSKRNNDEIKSFGKTESAIDEVKKFKSKKSVEQSLQDLEDTLIRDTIRDKKLVDSLAKNSPTLSKKIFSEDALDINTQDPYKKLLKDYEDLKNKEKKILKEVYEYNPDFKSYSTLYFDKENDYIKHDFLSLFDNLDDIDLELFETFSYAKPISNTNKMNDETLYNLRRIQEKTEQLERERRDIQFKIESLKSNTSYAAPLRTNPSVGRLLSELRDQQTLNEAALNLLRDRITAGNPSQVRSGIQPNVLPSLYSANNPVFLNNLKNNDLNFEDIRAMRLNYLQNGGHDSNILNKFTEMEYKMRHSNQYSSETRYYSSINSNTNGIENQIQKIDVENKRIQKELEQIQNKFSYGSLTNTDSTKKYENFLPPIQQLQVSQNQYFSPNFNNNYHKNTNESNRNFAINKDQANFQYSQPTNNQQSNRSQPNFTHPHHLIDNQNLLPLKDLPPAPYDPNGGFVLFIDFVTNIDPNFASARVITCLHHPKSGLGEPSVLPIVSTESFSDKNYQNTVALISTKQPVPRCPPQQALTILIELQMGLKNSNQTLLKSCAWVKIPLFDSKNRLLSGRWRCSLKNLPIKSESSIQNLNNIIDYGATELFYRLVNLRDSDEQTNAPISPIYADQYDPTSQENIVHEIDHKENIKEEKSYYNNQDHIELNDHLLENHVKQLETNVNKKTPKKTNSNNLKLNLKQINLTSKEENNTKKTIDSFSTRNRKEPKFLKGEVFLFN